MSNSERMRYEMVGDDGLNDEQRIQKYTGPVSYDYLIGPLRNGVLIQVDEALDLHAVAKALIQDDKKRVQAWLAEELIVVAQEATFPKKEGDAYTATVVTPFVLVK